MTDTEREIGRLGGVLEGIRDRLEDFSEHLDAQDAQRGRMDLRVATLEEQVRLMSGQLTTALKPIEDFNRLRLRAGGALVVIGLLAAAAWALGEPIWRWVLARLLK